MRPAHISHTMLSLCKVDYGRGPSSPQPEGEGGSGFYSEIKLIFTPCGENL